MLKSSLHKGAQLDAILEALPNTLPLCTPGQDAPDVSSGGAGWTRRPPEVPCNYRHSVIL